MKPKNFTMKEFILQSVDNVFNGPLPRFKALEPIYHVENISKVNDNFPDELKRLTNRCIGKLLDSLGNSVNDAQIALIKQQIRLFENNIRNNIFNARHSNENICK